ncbi:MAG: lytic murein transglycosylase B [Burkholderiales bacterium]|nr:lytic murein transglycosylase B [Burkholderiales bacterium]
MTSRIATALFMALALLGQIVPADAAPTRSGQRQKNDAPSRADFGSRPDVREFVAQMVERHGFVERELVTVFTRARRYPAIIDLITPPADPRVRSWQAYRARFVEPVRIDGGVALWQRHAAALARAEAQYGVPAEIIVAIMGVETVYGRNTGNWRVIDALATLAFDYPRRAPFFRGELENFLLFVREHDIDVFSVQGSYAGAIGIPQFMPSSWRNYAVDFNGDGRIDLRGSFEDSIGSIASFLKGHGWIAGAPIALRAEVSGTAYRDFLTRDILPSVPAGEIGRYGVVAVDPDRLVPSRDTPLALIDLTTPDRPTEYRLGFTNFYVITRYNRSSFYAASVLDLAQAIRAARALQAGKTPVER